MEKNLNIKAGIFAILTAGTLVALKLYAWIETDSLSIFSSLIDSSLDVATSVINLLAIGYALKPADDDHPYGHDSIEDIVGLIQAAFIFGSGCFIVYEALQRFYKPVAVSHNDLGIWVMLFSVSVTLVLVIYQKIVIARTKSLVVETDSVHYVTDILSGLLVITSLVATREPGMAFIDPLLAIVISVYIASSAFKIGKRAFDNLMNKEIDPKDQQRIFEVINADKRHNGFHDFKTRCSGNKIFVQFDLEMDGSLTLQQSHDIALDITKDITKLYPNSEVVIHFDPEKD